MTESAVFLIAAIFALVPIVLCFLVPVYKNKVIAVLLYLAGNISITILAFVFNSECSRGAFGCIDSSAIIVFLQLPSYLSTIICFIALLILKLLRSRSRSKQNNEAIKKLLE